MLVLSRKIGERIVIAENVVIQVLAVRRGQIRLGITAPPTVSIRREELPRCTPEELERHRSTSRVKPTPRTAGGVSHESSKDPVAVAP
jgi:carbon storage regulator